MTIREFRLLTVNIFSKDELVYSGEVEAAPEELKDKQVKIRKLDNKTLIVDLIEN
jgi:hypothetical protein